jgi:hypothetical protein
VPPAGAAAPRQTPKVPERPQAGATWSARDQSFLDLPREPAGSQAEEGLNEPSDIDTVGVAEPEGRAGSADGDETSAETPDRFWDAVLYPANLDGVVQIVILAVCLWLVRLLGGLFGRLAGPYSGLLVILARVIVLGYAVFYVGYCIYDSSRGGRRPPTVSSAHTPGVSDLVSQLLLLVGGVAICLWPAAVYGGVTGGTDVWFGALAAGGAFFLPMSLLTAALFDGIGALNPLLIVRSIAVTLSAYLALLLKLSVLGGVFLVIRWALGRVPVPQVLSTAAYLYLLLTGAYLLGRFYWHHKDRLGWGL